MDIAYLFRTLMRRRLLLILIPLVAGAAAFAFTFMTKRLYLSNVQLSTGFTAMRTAELGGNEMLTYNEAEVNNKFQNLIFTLRSKVMLNMVSYRLILHDVVATKDFYRSVQEYGTGKFVFNRTDLDSARVISQRKLDKFEPISTASKDEFKLLTLMKQLDYDYATLRDKINITRLGGSDYVQIEYASENPELSAFVVNALAEEFIRYNNQSNTEASVQSVKFLEEQVQQKLKIRDDKNLTLTQIRSKGSGGGTTFMEGINTRIGEMETLLQEERKKAQSARLQLANVTRQLDGSVDVQESPASINQRIAALQQRQRSLARRAAGNKMLQDSLSYVNNQLDLAQEKMANSGVNNSALKREELLARQDQLQVDVKVSEEAISSYLGQIGSLQNMLTRSTGAAGSIEALETEVKNANEEYIQAQNRLASVRSTFERSSLGAIRIALRGQPADEPQPRNTVVTTLFSGVVSLALCVFTLIMLEYMDTSVKIPSQFQKQTGMPLIGVVNELTPLAGVNKGKVNIEDIFTEEDDEAIQETTFRELIRKLRFEIENSGGKTFLFTSTKREEGKTSLMLALAWSLSTNQKKVLLIDTNFMNNTLTQLLNANPSLENSMINDMDHEFIITKQENIVSATRIHYVDIIGCEGGNYSPSEVFPERKFSNQIVTLAQRYDYIFLEGGALNLYSDSKELSNYVDKVVAVCSAKSTVKPADRESFAFLKSLKNKLVGAILNEVNIDNLEL
jgi:polysaccharide biosynthesis transport protein